MNYRIDDDMRQTGERLIEAKFPHLRDASICYLDSDEEKHSSGRTIYADAKKVGEPYRTITGYDFLITFYANAYDADVSDEARVVLMEHELMHIGYNEGECSIIPHDLDDFAAIVDAYGVDWIHRV